MFLVIAGLAISISLQSMWALVWCIGCLIMGRLDILVMRKVVTAIARGDSQGHELRLMLVGVILASLFVSAPSFLLLSFEPFKIIGGMALLAGGATRAASMLAVSPKVSIAYLAPYIVAPSVGLTMDMFVESERTVSGNAFAILALVCCLAYIWKTWLSRKSFEFANDQALSEAEADRDTAARDAMVSRLLFQHTTLRAALFDTHGRFIAVNASWLQAIGQTEDDVLGKTLIECMPDSKMNWFTAITNALAGQSTKVVADERTRRDGVQVVLDWEAQPWHNGDGTIGGAVAYAMDVTEVHQARAAAQSRQNRLELALKANKSFTVEVDYAAQTVSFDEAAVAFHGFEPSFAMYSKRTHSAAHPDDRETIKRQALQILENGGYGRIEAREIKSDGKIIWLRTETAPSAFTNGVPTRFVLLSTDITEEIARHERLATMMGRAKSALGEKRKLLQELCGDTNLLDAETDRAVAQQGPLVAVEGTESTFTQLFAGFEQILTEIDDRDIALAAAVQQLRDARTTAEAANVAKSQFLANMSHELRTPLNAIIGYTEILIEDAEYEQRLDAAKDATKVRTSATHLLSLINEILDLSKIEAGKMDITREATPLTDLIMDLVLTNETLVTQRGNKIVVEIDSERTLALTDGFRLRQCLLNLLSNACKFTEEGTITLRLATNDSDINNRWFELSVQDTGIGMSQEQQERLFRPFSQADGSTTRKYGGTGLGLALTREMLHLLGGDVSIISDVGVGSTFTIRIPAIGLEAADVQHIKGGDCDAALVLIVDDDPIARSLSGRAASALGMAIATAETGRAALEFCEQNQVDLVVLDIQLPDMDGYEVLMALRGAAETRNIPVMIVSVDDDRRKSIASGAQEHLAKPCPSAVLTAAMARLARRKADEGYQSHGDNKSEAQTKIVPHLQNQRSA